MVESLTDSADTMCESQIGGFISKEAPSGGLGRN